MTTEESPRIRTIFQGGMPQPGEPDVEELREEGGGQLGFWAKGHHDPWVFVQCIAAEFYGPDDDPPPTEPVQHLWWVDMPDGGGGTWMRNAEPTDEGAYSVTVLEGYRTP